MKLASESDASFELATPESFSLQEPLLFLSDHEKYPERFFVEGLDDMWFFELEPLVGRYRTIHVSALETFLTASEELGYRVLFIDDPEPKIASWKSLDLLPAFSLNSHLPKTKQGFLSFQIPGLNKLLKTPRGGFCVASTGVGKTALSAGWVLQHLGIEDFDLALVVVQKNNKVDTKAKLKKLGGIESKIFDGPVKKRAKVLDEILKEIPFTPQTVVLNYERFQTDHEAMIKMVQDRKVLVIWDEMPTKLSNRKTKLYDAVRKVLYGRPDKYGKIPHNTAWKNLWPRDLRQYCTSATPVEKSPIGILNMMRLIDPDFWPLIKEWETSYGRRKDNFTGELVEFKDLDRMHLELEAVTARISKEDPEILALFPEVVPERIEIEMSPYDRALYEKMQGIAEDLLNSDEEITPLQLISVMRLICAAPSILELSASRRDEFEAMMEEWAPESEDQKPPTPVGSLAAQMLIDSHREPITDKHSQKLYALREILNIFKDEKVLIFSALAGYIQPVLKAHFDAWGITYEVFAGTDKQCQDAKDRWRSNPDTQVLLLSDKGSTGLDLPEAMVGINLDLPWKWSTKVQRQNRNNRVDSLLKINYWFDLVYKDTVEGRIEEIISKKRGFHEAVFDGVEGVFGEKLTKAEIRYILLG